MVVKKNHMKLTLTGLLVSRKCSVALVRGSAGLYTRITSRLSTLIVYKGKAGSGLLRRIGVRSTGCFVTAAKGSRTGLLSYVLIEGCGIRRIVTHMDGPSRRRTFGRMKVRRMVDPRETTTSCLRGVIAEPGATRLVAVNRKSKRVLSVAVAGGGVINGGFGSISPAGSCVVVTACRGKALVVPRPSGVVDHNRGISILIGEKSFGGMSGGLRGGSWV